MAVLFFAIAKNQYTFGTREFVDFLKKGVIAQGDQKKISGMEVNNLIKFLVRKHERFNNEFS